MSAFGAELARQRTAARLNQTRLARASGIDRTAICHLETGGRQPRRATVEALADALRVTEYGRIRLHLAAGFVPRGYVVTGIIKEDS